MRKAIAMGLMGMGSVLGVWAACNSPNNIRVTVDITAPADVPIEQLTMSAVDAAFTTLTAASSGDDDNQLKWTFAGFVFPSSGNSGTSVAMKTPAAWPADNSFWGEKDVELEYDGGVEGTTGDCEAKVGVKVFFDPVVDIGDEPAWFKYWQDGAIPGLSGFTYSEFIPGSSQAALGRYDCDYNAFVRSFYVVDVLPENEELWIAKGAHTTSTTTPKLNIAFSGKPLIIVAAVVEHELDHKARRWFSNVRVQMLWTNWWSSLSVADKAWWLVHPNDGDDKLESFWDMVDSDRDSVLNGSDPTHDPDSTYDNEVAAEQAMSGDSRVTSEDWSKGGEQWEEE